LDVLEISVLPFHFGLVGVKLFLKFDRLLFFIVVIFSERINFILKFLHLFGRDCNLRRGARLGPLEHLLLVLDLIGELANGLLVLV
jgi:hypothetical protein